MIFYVVVCFLLFCVLKYHKIKRVYQLYRVFKTTVDPEDKKYCCEITYDIFKIAKLFVFPPAPPPTLDKFNKKLVKVPYQYKEKEFVYLLKVPKGVMPIDFIRDEEGNNIFDDIFPYLGPNLDCHNMDIYPRDFGLKHVHIKDINDNEYHFDEDDCIRLTDQHKTKEQLEEQEAAAEQQAVDEKTE